MRAPAILASARNQVRQNWEAPFGNFRRNIGRRRPGRRFSPASNRSIRNRRPGRRACSPFQALPGRRRSTAAGRTALPLQRLASVVEERPRAWLGPGVGASCRACRLQH